MSFRCQITKLQSEKNVGPLRLTVQTRPRTYHKWVKDEESREWMKVEAGTGFEIVREISVSKEGADIWDNWNDLERELFLKKGIVSRSDRKEDDT